MHVVVGVGSRTIGYGLSIQISAEISVNSTCKTSYLRGCHKAPVYVTYHPNYIVQ